MAPAEPLQPSRDAALRALLVDLARQPDVRVGRAGDPFGLLRGRELVRVGLITVAVLAIVAVVSALAIRATLQIRAAEFGGAPGVPAGPSGPTTDPSPAEPTLPPGKLLGRFTSAEGADQRHVIHPDGLAIATAFTCSGKGAYTVSITHYEAFGGGGPDRCSASDSSRGNKGRAGETTVTIHSGSKVRWTLTIVGVPETYVTPQPVSTPTTITGALSRFCTAADLMARFEPVQEPHGVTEVAGGQIAFTDRSSSGCTLAGYSMVRFLDHGVPLGHHTMDAVDSAN